MSVYLQGSIIESEVRFLNPDTNTAADPTTVEFRYQIAGQSPTAAITYTSATIPAVGVIAKLGIGWYKTWIDSTSFIGKTLEMWDGLGANQAPGDRWFEVIARGSE